mmetsp:Transcript_4857/g.5630  ORF Transcript_4857/g.5630 Transcript_4857/m.5630 type:complete len:402 (-) Transcript_4857:445-1650(-)
MPRRGLLRSKRGSRKSGSSSPDGSVTSSMSSKSSMSSMSSMSSNTKRKSLKRSVSKFLSKPFKKKNKTVIDTSLPVSIIDNNHDSIGSEDETAESTLVDDTQLLDNLLGLTGGDSGVTRNGGSAESHGDDTLTADVVVTAEVKDAKEECRDESTMAIDILSDLTTVSRQQQQQQQQLGFRQIGGPIQPSIANQFSKEDIVTLLRNRTNARRDRHFSKADEILQTLSDAGIFVNDSRKIWRADGFFSVTEVDNDDDSGGVSNTDYVKSKKSKYINDDDTKHVLKRLEQRTEAKRNKDYMTADTIRDELRYLFHIEVNDSIKTWSVLGEEKSSFLKGDYVFGGKRVANIPEDDLSAIEDLIKQRVEAKTRKDYVVADAILADLKVRYSVRVDDKKKQWHLSPV